MTKQYTARVQLKKDTSANWTATNPVLLDGEEILVVTEAGDIRRKTGDGVKTYTQLPFDDEAVRNLVNGKQDKLTGNAGQFVGFDESGNAAVVEAPVAGVTLDEVQAYVDTQTPIMKSVSLPAASWSGSAAPYTQVITVSGVLADGSKQRIDVAPDAASIAVFMEAGGVYATRYAQNNLTFSAMKKKPTSNITMNISLTPAKTA